MSERTTSERVETAPGITQEDGLFGPYKFIRLKSGRKMTFWEAIRLAESAHTDLGRALSRAFKLANAEWDLEAIELRLDRIEEHCAALRKHLRDLHGEQTIRERIASLRNTTGRTPEEAELYLRKANELEASL